VETAATKRPTRGAAASKATANNHTWVPFSSKPFLLLIHLEVLVLLVPDHVINHRLWTRKIKSL
jgi:hypothetical protein